ncbi:MAG: Dyp-type peroxidase [Phenylobacterium sp.]
MSQVMVTIVAPLAPGRLAQAEARIDALGNPCGGAARDRIEATQGALGVHFMSLHALASRTPGKAHLLLEFSADGPQARALAQIVQAIGPELTAVFSLAADWPGGELTAYLTRKVIAPGFRWSDPPGLAHSGAPGMTVGRIRQEAVLAPKLRDMLGRQKQGMTALERLDAIRHELGPADPALTLPEGEPLFTPLPLAVVIGQAAVSFVVTFLWPALLLVALWAAFSGYLAGRGEGAFWRMAAMFALGFLKGAVLAGLVFLGASLIAAALVYLQLRRQEEDDWTSDRAPDAPTLGAILERENFVAQNHMVSVTQRKPGWLRAFTLRLAFWGVGTLGPRLYQPGYLGPIGTIHFARWVTPPGSDDLIFLSNYGGSWEAYLEDFITLAHFGLTAVWSNTIGFPKTQNLIQDGATDGERFKRYARQSMVPTRFWYSAYPELVTDTIRANAAIRRGLAAALTEDDAARWLSRFGSALRPEGNMTTSQIQSLVFGGLGFMPESACQIWRAPADVAQARRWLKALGPLVAFGDGRKVRDDPRINAVIQLAISAPGLRAFGLPEATVETFPPAFLDGMAAPHRARILGDTGDNDPQYWWWGQEPPGQPRTPTVALMIYAQDAAAFAKVRAQIAGLGRTHRAKLVQDIPLKSFDRADNLEPFGFADGGSQPVIRGTYKGLKSGGDPMHMVEPGEFVLGYPDNRGNVPPGPRMAAILDPDNMLPVCDAPIDPSANDVNSPRAVGRNGSFLVIRQLEQDDAAFQGYCDQQARRLKTRLGPPYVMDAEFIAAKLMGRWRNGAPLVRSPYTASGTDAIIKENSFRLGEEDPEGLRCPFGSHIRRANPRDSINPGSQDQIDISNRHRILRVGRKYEPKAGQKGGLLFACLNGDLERQFEFVQQTWALGNVISLSCPITLQGQRDPVLAGGPQTNTGFTIPTLDGPVVLPAPPRFVTMRGGGYFFLPGRTLLAYLSTGDVPPHY